ncbi:glycerophosphoryl diester phosphodiesterase [Nonomuraea maritima]|uniref:Glycerophosphoryl diester phosphodiesterase n=1 Tax=Nonomuraea maritima TaxID=683260 RepID=A0A1G9JVB2_9ACTN|nr:glycerophosphodiester phosphodiesterase family protein [Nonomuraea maritima]SDL41094.1 glycerophosphoryl diester phosphodiesterase [Nonomuraea maritima]
MYRLLGAIVIATVAGLATPAWAAAPGNIEVIAHRGGSVNAPENTLAACALARAQQADACEFDIQQTKDHQLVLMHDETLSRTTDVEQVFPGRSPWHVADFTLAEIRRLDAGSWFSSRYRDERVPTLREALDQLGGSGTGLLLEVKHSPRSPDIDQQVAAVLQETRDQWRGNLVLQTFDWRALRVVHDQVPEVPIVLLGNPSLEQLRGVADYVRGVTLSQRLVTEEYIKELRRKHMRVYAIAGGRRPVIRRLMGYGVDGILTSNPERVAELTWRRGGR